MDMKTSKDFERLQYRKFLGKMKKDSLRYIKSIYYLMCNDGEILEQWEIFAKEKGADIVSQVLPFLEGQKRAYQCLVAVLRGSARCSGNLFLLGVDSRKEQDVENGVVLQKSIPY